MATTAHELDSLTSVDLEQKLREAKEELFNLRFQARHRSAGEPRPSPHGQA